jgi:hypothetical protein
MLFANECEYPTPMGSNRRAQEARTCRRLGGRVCQEPVPGAVDSKKGEPDAADRSSGSRYTPRMPCERRYDLQGNLQRAWHLQPYSNGKQGVGPVSMATSACRTITVIATPCRSGSIAVAALSNSGEHRRACCRTCRRPPGARTTGLRSRPA